MVRNIDTNGKYTFINGTLFTASSFSESRATQSECWLGGQDGGNSTRNFLRGTYSPVGRNGLVSGSLKVNCITLKVEGECLDVGWGGGDLPPCGRDVGGGSPSCDVERGRQVEKTTENGTGRKKC